MFLSMLFSTLFNKKLMKTFRWQEFQIEEIEETKETLSSSSKNSTKDKWIALNWKRFEIDDMTLTMSNHSISLVIYSSHWKQSSTKSYFFFKFALATTINMFSSIVNIDAIELNDFLSINSQQRAFEESRKRNRRIDSYLAHIEILSNDRS